MALTNTAIRTTKPRAKPLELSDRRGVVVRIVNYPRFLAVIGLLRPLISGRTPGRHRQAQLLFLRDGSAHNRMRSMPTTKQLQDFRSILSERRTQINSNQKLPGLPGQAHYRARISMMGTYKGLTDALPSKIGRPNEYGIPPAYLDADNEPLIDEYKNLFRHHAGGIGFPRIGGCVAIARLTLKRNC